jgi:uncharacterized Tic20 family protein
VELQQEIDGKGDHIMTDLDSLTPSQDERVMAALSQISVLVPFLGVVAPIVIWVTQKDKSRYVAFQSLQAIAFQLTMILTWFVGMGCYMCSFFSVFLMIPFGSTVESSESVSPFFVLPFFTPFLVMGLMFLGGFLFILYGIIAAVMTFQGKSFRYVIIGRRVERFLQDKQNVAPGQ